MSALLLIDLQNDFLPTGSLPVCKGDEVVERCNAIRKSRNFTLTALSQDNHPLKHASFASTHDAELFSSRTIPTPDRTLKPRVTDTVNQVMWPDHCVQGSSGAEFAENLIREETDFLVPKGTNALVDSYSAFGDEFEGQFEDTGLGDKLASLSM
jgi:nicotinamidase-related amidase